MEQRPKEPSIDGSFGLFSLIRTGKSLPGLVFRQQNINAGDLLIERDLLRSDRHIR